MNYIYFFCIAFIGGYVGTKIKVPAGSLIGSMFAVGLWQYTHPTDPLEVSNYVRWIGQWLLGMSFGLLFLKRKFKVSKKLIVVLFLFGVISVLYSFFVASIVYLFGETNFVSSFLASVQGGFAEMLILTESINENVTIVALFHFLRVFLLLLIIPFALNWLKRKEKGL